MVSIGSELDALRMELESARDECSMHKRDLGALQVPTFVNILDYSACGYFIPLFQFRTPYFVELLSNKFWSLAEESIGS